MALDSLHRPQHILKLRATHTPIPARCMPDGQYTVVIRSIRSLEDYPSARHYYLRREDGTVCQVWLTEPLDGTSFTVTSRGKRRKVVYERKTVAVVVLQPQQVRRALPWVRYGHDKPHESSHEP